MNGAVASAAITDSASAGGTLPVRIPRHVQLQVERPVVLAQRLVPDVAEPVPVCVADRDAAEPEQSVLVEPTALIEEEECTP